MKIKIRCSSCGMGATANEQLFGKTVPCPKCKAPIKVPVPKQTPQQAQQPLAPTTLNSVRYQTNAPRKKPKSSSDVQLILMIVGVAVGALLVGGGIVWAILASGNSRVADAPADNRPSTGIASSATGASDDASLGAATPASDVGSSAIRAPWLTFKYAPQKSYVYELDFVSKNVSGVESTESCTMVLETASQKSVDSKPKKQLNANTYCTGLGLPGKRVIIPTETIEMSTALEVQIGGMVYPAWRGPDLGNPNLTLLEYDGPDLPPIRVNPFHDYEPTPFVIQRDPMAKLFLKGRVRTKVDITERPLDEIRKQMIDGTARTSAGASSYNQTGVAFDRTGTLYGIVSDKGDISPTALLQTLVAKLKNVDAPLFDETPFEKRKRLTEQELAELVGSNVVSVHATNPPSLDKRVFGGIKIVDSQIVNCGPYSFDADSFEQLNWTFVGQKEFRKGGGSFPFFLGRCSDLLFFNLTGQRTDDWSVSELVQSNGKSRYNVKSKKWNTSSKNIPGSLTEELEITDHDPKVAKISRKITVRFPDMEPFTVPELWKPGEKDKCIVEATQLINFDHQKGVVLDSTTTGTIEHALDNDEEKEEFEIRMRLVEWKSKSPPKQLRPMSQDDVNLIVEWLSTATIDSKQKAIAALLEIQPEDHDTISAALARHKPTERGWDSPFHKLAQRWILPAHTKLYLSTEGQNARSSVVPEILRILELRPPVEPAKPLIRKALFQPDRQEYGLAGRVVRNTYPDMAMEVADSLKAATEHKEYHGEWLRCLKCVGNSDCVPALETYIANIQAMGPRYNEEFERYIKYAQQAMELAKARPATGSAPGEAENAESPRKKAG